MSPTYKVVVTLRQETVRILEEFQEQEGLASLDAAIDSAAEALRDRQLAAAYMKHAREHAQDAIMQLEAEAWLGSQVDEG